MKKHINSINNEGFILPLTLMFLIIVSVFFTYNFNRVQSLSNAVRLLPKIRAQIHLERGVIRELHQDIQLKTFVDREIIIKNISCSIQYKNNDINVVCDSDPKLVLKLALTDEKTTLVHLFYN